MLILMQSKKVNRKLECLCLNITKFRCYKARSLGKNQQTSPNNLSVFCACDTSGNFPYIITTFRQRKGGTLSIFTQVRLTSTEKLKKNPLGNLSEIRNLHSEYLKKANEAKIMVYCSMNFKNNILFDTELMVQITMIKD